MGHTHSHVGSDTGSARLTITALLNFVITATELIGGLAAGSLALLSDALHNFSDGIAVIVSLVALHLARRAFSPRKTFGYKRVEILAAMFNAVTLIVICVFLFQEAIQRFSSPPEIKTGLMIGIALIGLAANGIAVLLLHRQAGGNINIRAAYLHLFSDMLSSLAVVLGGIVIHFWRVYWLDPALTILVGLFVLRESLRLLGETVDILLHSTPASLDILAVKERLEQVSGVDNVHHIHAWKLTDRETHFEGHVRVGTGLDGPALDQLRQRLEQILTGEFGLSHTVLQMEFKACCSEDAVATHTAPAEGSIHNHHHT